MGQTVFVTGATGYIAKHIIRDLLDAGHSVIGSVRRSGGEREVRDALRPHLSDPEDAEARLRFAMLDLDRDEGWDSALAGADALVHTASPFPMTQPKDPQELIRPAVDGARRALAAARAANIGRVVMTSSTVAVIQSPLPRGMSAFDETCWTDPDAPGMTAYARSKTLAERAAWDFVDQEAPDMALTTINPGLVLGAPLDRRHGTSVGVIQRILRARDPMLPRMGFPVVDVRDVATMHTRALERPETAGQRYLAADRFQWFVDLGQVLKAAYPDRKIVTRQAPDIIVRMLALFDPAIRSIIPDLGIERPVSNARARDEMDMHFVPAEQSIRDTAAYLLREGMV